MSTIERVQQALRDAAKRTGDTSRQGRTELLVAALVGMLAEEQKQELAATLEGIGR